MRNPKKPFRKLLKIQTHRFLIADFNECANISTIVLSPGDIIIIILGSHDKLHVASERARNSSDIDSRRITDGIDKVRTLILIVIWVLVERDGIIFAEFRSESKQLRGLRSRNRGRILDYKVASA